MVKPFFENGTGDWSRGLCLVISLNPIDFSWIQRPKPLLREKAALELASASTGGADKQATCGRRDCPAKERKPDLSARLPG